MSRRPRSQRQWSQQLNRNFLKQAQQIQARLAKAQEDLEAETVEGSAGGGAVRVVANGKLKIPGLGAPGA